MMDVLTFVLRNNETTVRNTKRVTRPVHMTRTLRSTMQDMFPDDDNTLFQDIHAGKRLRDLTNS